MFYGIVAISKNNVIGRYGEIPWKIPEDLKFFRKVTFGQIVIMGRKKYESLPGKYLPGRINIVVTSKINTDCNDEKDTHNIIFTTIENLFHILETFSPQLKRFVIGGAKLYETLLPFIHVFYVTLVDKEILDGDTFFHLPNNTHYETTNEFYSDKEKCKVEFLTYYLQPNA